MTAPILVDANEAVASVAHRLNEVIAIYAITPSSAMGEMADDWSVHGHANIWGEVPEVVEMQSEGGAIGAVHGALQGGSLTTTFTASQGLLLMIPNLYKIAGELNSFCMHVAARTVATHALSIFGDHSDVMACRQTGCAMLASNSVQEAQDFAAIGQMATLKSRVPFIHFFDGFRTSHEINKIEPLADETLTSLIDWADVAAHRDRALNPERPAIRGTAQNPDVFFQAREACNPFYDATPELVDQAMTSFAEQTGRDYHLFDYVGHPQAERVLVMMGSGADTAHQTIEHLAQQGERVGLIKVRLYRPFARAHFIAALPTSVRCVVILDRTKEPGAVGEPLYLDVVTALQEAAQRGELSFAMPHVTGGRYGLSGKEFTPAMVKATVDHAGSSESKQHFTVGITDDVTRRSLPVDDTFDIEAEDESRCVFFGLGSDGTVGANKNSIKIIGQRDGRYAQGYFVYDSKKSGAMTVSHLRFGPRPIRAPYLISRANFVACHQFAFLEKRDVLSYAEHGATVLLNAPFPADQVWDRLPREVQQQIRDKALTVYTIDAYKVARDVGMGRRVNTIMQTCFFKLANVMPVDEAIDHIKTAIEKTYGRKGEEVVRRNKDAVDQALAHLHQMPVGESDAQKRWPALVPGEAPDFVQRVTGVMMAGRGDELPVSAFPVDGTWPSATSKWEKRNVAPEIPIWEPELCIQCNKCTLVCPHAAIRAKVADPAELDRAPDTFKSADYKAKDFRGQQYILQVAPEDCTGCNLCVNVCPAKDKSNPRRKAINMAPQLEHRDTERQNYDFFLDLPDVDTTQLSRLDVKGSQFLRPLFEYSGACSGCGETPYIKLLTQLFGDRAMIANATGCSSIYGGNLPTTPYCVDGNGRGPAWSNSLFEDNAEFGFGMRLAVDSLHNEARHLLKQFASDLDERLIEALLSEAGDEATAFSDKRAQLETLKQQLATLDSVAARRLLQIADYLLDKSIWLIGGDGWAYDIGYGGLDHVLSMNRNVNVLVLDTEVYSNTGGQQSKATPLGAAAKFAAAGKDVHKKDLGLMAMSYGHVYVASVAMGGNDNHTVKALQEAEAYPGPSLIIAYSHCIAHGYDMAYGLDQQQRAVQSGLWPLYRFDPRLIEQHQPPLQLDSKTPKLAVSDYTKNETRFRMVERVDPDRFERLGQRAQQEARQRIALYQQLAALTVPGGSNSDNNPHSATETNGNPKRSQTDQPTHQ
jgi:pyruvate-ferredoxin/flavodoxin oxidoreductase